jgi:hypothetical protein
MTALTIQAKRQLPKELLVTLRRANLDLVPLPSPGQDDLDFSHLHSLSAEEEEQAFQKAMRANQKRFWSRNSHLL